MVLCLDVDQHLGDNGAGEAGVNEGQVGQEEPTEERLLVWVWREAQEQEVRDAGSVSNVLLN